MPRGYKECPNCQASNTTTAAVCTDCGYDFASKTMPSDNPPPTNLVTDYVSIINECLPDGWIYMGYFFREDNHFHIAMGPDDAVIKRSLRELMMICWKNF